MSKKSEKKGLEKAEKKPKKASKKDQKVEKATSSAARLDVSPQDRAEMIATAAYYIAERHGFTPGRAEADWKAAEEEINRVLKGKKGKKKSKSKKG